MNKTVCDRCGKTINDNVDSPLSIGVLTKSFVKHLYLKESNPFSELSDIDLCDDCEKQLYEWLKNKNKECSCADRNIIELLDMIENHEKKICDQSGEIEQLKKENEILRNGAIQDILEKCHFKIEFNIDEE